MSDSPMHPHHSNPVDVSSGEPAATRRHFLLIGLGALLAGCTSQPRVGSTLPAPVWRPRESESPAVARDYPRPITPSPAPAPAPVATGGVIDRSQWATSRPIASRMQRMTPIRFITVHHDGMTPFYDNDERNTINRLESIRRFHRDRLNWGDIGYHYAIDRAGRVWEGRPLGYQGAHVGNHNEGNIGVLVLGNFDQQSPSDRQLQALNSHLSQLMRVHGISAGRVTTHREWSTARTVCPGAALQSHMDSIRRRGVIS